MKIIDSFMFSEPYEKELLLLKLEMENDVVDEWIIIEGSYSFQGEYKGHHINRIIAEDNRFLSFKDKIKVFEADDNFNHLYLMSPLEYIRRYIKMKIPKYRQQLVALSEEASFFAEKNQREIAVDYVVENCKDNDYLILTDIDEMLDATRKKKKEAFLGVLNSSEPCFKIKRKIFIYDFDNLTYRKRYSPIINIASIKKLKIKTWVAQYIRTRLIWEGMKKIDIDEDLFYEFSYCFEKSKIIRKEKTYAHTGRGDVEIERALLCNHSFKNITMINKDFINNKENWFEKIDANDDNLPHIIVDRFQQLRTNSVAVNYKEMRKKYYGIC
jgi:hypothetical protein